MPSFIQTHANIQRLLSQTDISSAALSAVVRDILALAQQPEFTFEDCLSELKKRGEQAQGPQPSVTLQLLLIAWAGRHKPLVTAYLHKLMLQALVQQRPTQTGQILPSQVLYCAGVIAKQRYEGTPLRTIFAQLREQSTQAEGRELIAQVLRQQATPTQDAPPPLRLKPLPQRFLQAVRDWPDNELLLDKVIHVVNQHPILQQRLCHQATLHTQQRRLLTTKQALLLLGPEASRELLLTSHFEAHLTAPRFPLRRHILQRRSQLAGCLQGLCRSASIQLPCTPELLSYLWVYDLWFHGAFTTQLAWQPPAGEQAPSRVALWVPWLQNVSSARALKLIDYWQMPTELAEILMGTHTNQALLACIQLAHVGSILVSDYGNDLPHAWQPQLTAWCRTVGISLSHYQSLLWQLAQDQRAHSPFQPLPL
ncbi:hypothetical protein CWE15_04150 [Aliidiomarina taiwanensis]|uniref:Uncharacterized protein n=1 Tax=Aliidiomarina taiwanensis TaxID=946228 RepID=A0A432XAM2_9GAMM|nr:hypothetical protein [Aliidiomarina taiwanensis]RUO44374.1 hypothetical protein CWE15_04150 [Aliidiomarina taiwanensis]